MRVLTCTTPGTFQYSEASNPQLRKDHALIKVKRIGICGTDLHAFEGTQPYFSYPRILGHELSGELVDVDGADFKKGETVTIIPYFNCGTCVACRTGKTNCCAQLKVFGVHIDGGMSDYIVVPSYSLVHGDGLTPETLALAEPLAIGAHGIRRAGVTPGEFVLVIGAGPIGLGTLAFARIAGGNVIVADVSESRLKFCKDQMSIQHVINAKTENVLERLREITNNDMPTVVIDATGNLGAINNSFQYLAHGGRYVLIGLQKGDIIVNHPEFHKREATLMSSRNATRADFEHVLRCIREKRLNAETFITHRVEFDRVKDQFAGWLNPANGVIKAMVHLD